MQSRAQKSKHQKKPENFTEDVFESSSFMSFDKSKRTYPNRKGPKKNVLFPVKPLVKQEVVDIPLEMDTDDYVIDPKNIVTFFGRKNYFSNLYPCKIMIDGIVFSSVEHYYQSSKVFTLLGLRGIWLDDDPIAMRSQVKNILRGKVTLNQIEKWKRTYSYHVLRTALLAKFTQHTHLKEAILATDNKILAQAYERENLFATGCKVESVEEWAKENAGTILKIPKIINDEHLKYSPLVGEGKNILGIICMQVRRAIRDFEYGNSAKTVTAAVGRTRKDTASPFELVTDMENLAVTSPSPLSL